MAKKTLKTIVANRILLNDLKGNPRIILDASGDECAFIHILDATKSSAVELTVHFKANESSIGLFNKVSMNGSDDGGGSVTIRDENGHLKITMFCHPETKEPIIKTYK